MCGIFALIGDTYESSNLTDSDGIKSFNACNKRGPEYSKIEKINNNLLGFHRLAINGLSDSGNQPFYYKQYILICNGEIYNYKQLIKDYNLNVTTGSDCEVILHLYYLFGKKCLTMLDGEFAFVIYDTKLDLFFIARDPYGVRPLYINNINNT